VDSSTDSLVGGALDLGSGCLNASGLALSGTTLWVGCGFYDYGTTAVSGAALVPVELGSGTPVVGAPIAAPNAILSLAICGGRGYAGASDSGTVLAFDPGTGQVTATALACPAAASYVPGIACAP